MTEKYTCEELEKKVLELEQSEIKLKKTIELISMEASDRKRMEEWLHLTQISVDQAVEGISWIDSDARIIYANEAECRHLGYSREELLKMSVFDIAPQVKPEMWKKHREELRQQGNVTFEAQHRTKDGNIVTVEMSVRCVQHVGKEYCFNFKRDISDRKRAETALQRRIEFEQLVAKISSGLAGKSGSELDPAITCAIEAVGDFIGADRACVFQFNKGGVRVEKTHEWCHEGITPHSNKINSIMIDAELPYLAAHIRRNETYYLSDPAMLPPEARQDREQLEAQGILSFLIVPMETSVRLEGFVCFDTTRNRRNWSEEDRNMLCFLAGTICHVIERKKAEAERERLISELQAAVADIKTLSGLLPICSFCKKIRDDKGYWKQIESYIQEHSAATFSHGICRECAQKYYPDMAFYPSE